MTPIGLLAIGIVLVRMICHIVVSSLLIDGARKGRPGFLTPWIVVTVILFILNTICFFLTMMAEQWTLAIFSSISIGVYLYPYVVVQSFKKQLETSNEKCPPL